MSVNRTNCERCCLRLYGDDLDGFCERCTKEMREASLSRGHRALYESMRIEHGTALCDKVKAEKEVERLEALVLEALDSDQMSYGWDARATELLNPAPEVKP